MAWMQPQPHESEQPSQPDDKPKNDDKPKRGTVAPNTPFYPAEFYSPQGTPVRQVQPGVKPEWRLAVNGWTRGCGCIMLLIVGIIGLGIAASTGGAPIPDIIQGVINQVNPAAPIPFGETMRGETTNGGQGRWQFTGELGQYVNVQLEGDETDFDTVLSIHAPNGSEIARNDDSGGVNISQVCDIRLPENGTYTITVDGFSDSDFGAYELTLESGNTMSDATLIEFGETAEGTVSACGGDHFEFRGGAGTPVTITMAVTGGDAYLTLYNADGEELTSNDDSDGLDSRIDYTLAGTGSYFIAARDLRHRTDLPYVLRLTKGERE